MAIKIKLKGNETLNQILELLEEINKSKDKELPLKEIEKIMFYIGVERIKATGGSAVNYRHEILLNLKNYTDGRFQIHIVHGKKQEMIVKRNFKKYLFPTLKNIILLLQEL